MTKRTHHLTMDEIREALDEDFLKHPACPVNTLHRDFLVATINFVEKVDLGEKEISNVVMECTEAIAASSAACYINVAYRLFGINKNEPQAAVKIAEYIENTMRRVFYDKLAAFATIQLTEDTVKNNDKGTTKG